MANLIYVGMTYGLDFLDKENNIVAEMMFASKEAQDKFMDLPDSQFFATFPPSAKTAQPWQRKEYRLPVYGIDYGTGSVKARFGGYVPRGAYQFGG